MQVGDLTSKLSQTAYRRIQHISRSRLERYIYCYLGLLPIFANAVFLGPSM